MNAGKSAVIILAAGFSSRMQDFKPLLEIGGSSLLDRLVRNYNSLPVDIFVVVGWQKEKLLPIISRNRLKVVENPLYEEGMFSSIQAGVSALLTNTYQRFFVQPVDIPLVRQFSLQSILKCGLGNPEKIVYPVFNQKRGHPVLIPASFASGILEWEGGGGLKGYLTEFQKDAIDLPVADSYINFDLDNPGDYQRMLAAFGGYSVPSRDECEALLKNVYAVPLPLYEHCQAVGELAIKMGTAIKEKLQGLDMQKIEAAARLHDLAKSQGNHSQRGAEILDQMGFNGISRIVAQHTDLTTRDEISWESKIVFIADKYISGKQRIELAERFAEAKHKHGFSAEVQARIDQRRETTLRTKKELENILGYSLDQIVFA